MKTGESRFQWLRAATRGRRDEYEAMQLVLAMLGEQLKRPLLSVGLLEGVWPVRAKLGEICRAPHSFLNPELDRIIPLYGLAVHNDPILEDEPGHCARRKSHQLALVAPLHMARIEIGSCQGLSLERFGDGVGECHERSLKHRAWSDENAGRFLSRSGSRGGD